MKTKEMSIQDFKERFGISGAELSRIFKISPSTVVQRTRNGFTISVDDDLLRMRSPRTGAIYEAQYKILAG